MSTFKINRQHSIKNGMALFYLFVFVYLLIYFYNIQTRSFSGTYFFFIVLYGSFLWGSFVCVNNLLRTRQYFKHIGSFDMSLRKLKSLAKNAGKELPHIAILVPARNEGYVIGNTIRRLAKLEYPTSRYRIVVIVDEREQDDGAEHLTKDVVNETIQSFSLLGKRNIISCIEVPSWYSGVFGSIKSTYEKSTKGRALNYTLQHGSALGIDSFDIIGVLDADGRMDVNVLKEVAYNHIVNGSKLMQGPVFQVSNFEQSSLVGVIAGLELATHHLTELSHYLNRKEFHFLAGTNYFIDRSLIWDLGGWDQHALVEDAELALRLYMKNKVTATWLDSPEIEQTPPNVTIYCKQRERWVRGHLSLISMVFGSRLTVREKSHFLLKVFSSQLRFFLDIGFPILALIFIISGIMPALDYFLSFVSWFLFACSLVNLNVYGHMYHKLRPFIATPISQKRLYAMLAKLFLFTPIMLFVQAVPRVHAFYRFVRNTNTGVWYKTERTKEVVVE